MGGGKSQACAREPRQAGDLLVLQAEILLAKTSETDAKLALQNAEDAGRLLPDSGLPQLVRALALERLGRCSEALTALDVAWDIGATCRHATLDRKACKSLETRLKDRLAVEKATAHPQNEQRRASSAQEKNTYAAATASLDQRAVSAVSNTTATDAHVLGDSTKAQPAVGLGIQKKRVAAGKAKVRAGKSPTIADSSSSCAPAASCKSALESDAGEAAAVTSEQATTSDGVVCLASNTNVAANFVDNHDDETAPENQRSADGDDLEQAHTIYATAEPVGLPDASFKDKFQTNQTSIGDDTRSAFGTPVKPRVKEGIGLQRGSRTWFFMCCRPHNGVEDDMENEMPIQVLGA